MKVELNGTALCIDVPEMLESLDDDARGVIIESLSCQERIIEFVCQQIIDGWTDGGWHGFKSYGEPPRCALDRARRLLAESASEVAKKEIGELSRDLQHRDESWRDEMTKRIAAEHAVSELRYQLREREAQS